MYLHLQMGIGKRKRRECNREKRLDGFAYDVLIEQMIESSWSYVVFLKKRDIRPSLVSALAFPLILR